MSVGILSKYIDDLLNAEDEDIQHYLSQVPGGREDLLPLLLAAQAAHRAIAAIEIDSAVEGESRERAQEALAAWRAEVPSGLLGKLRGLLRGGGK